MQAPENGRLPGTEGLQIGLAHVDGSEHDGNRWIFYTGANLMGPVGFLFDRAARYRSKTCWHLEGGWHTCEG